MPRGVHATGETQEEAERQALDGHPHMRGLRSREMDLSDFTPRAGLIVGRHWAVVVEDEDPQKEAQLEQHDDPEAHCERETRELFAALASNPQSLVVGSIEECVCPAEPVKSIETPGDEI
jgi:hypothetical protein